MSKTSIMRAQGIRDSTEQDVKDNYAAEYAKRLFEKEAKDRTAGDNTLQGNIETEARARQSADDILQDNIDTEGRKRNAADDTLQRNINDEVKTRRNADNDLQANIDDEAEEREQADNTLQQNINTEAEIRAEADRNLQKDIANLQQTEHTHENKELLDTITQRRMETWDAEGGNKVLFRNAMYDAVNMFRDIYRAVGIDIYDGGYVNMTVIDKTIDGGSVTDTDIRLTIDGGEITERRKAENTAFATTEEITDKWNEEDE